MAGRFTRSEWQTINDYLAQAPDRFGLPGGGREGSLVLVSFNLLDENSPKPPDNNSPGEGRIEDGCIDLQKMNRETKSFPL